MTTPASNKAHRVVIVGGGFGGLYAAKALSSPSVQVTVIDRRNFHLFQPLLYQVATGELSPGEIASPLRAVLKKQQNATVLMGQVVDIDPQGRRVILSDGEVAYDALVIATGASHHYFGHPEWSTIALGIKTIEDALNVRHRILLAFEAAEREPSLSQQNSWMTFVIIGGGPTGVELAGAIGELAHDTLKHNFRRINPADARILLVESAERLLPNYPPDLSSKAKRALNDLGVTVRTGTLVTDIQPDHVVLKGSQGEESISTRTTFWCAGVKASDVGVALAKRTGAELDKAGRVKVNADLSVPGFQDIFVIGDLAHYAHQGGQPLPGVAPVAMQQGKFVAKLILNRLKGKNSKPFHYVHKGNLAVIGRNAAVVDFGFWRSVGFVAWLAWLFVHISYLIGFDSKLRVLFQWFVDYLTRKRGVRLITGDDPYPLVKKPQD